MTRYALALLLAIAASSAGAAGAIYRCGPDGRTYSQTPCADGTLMEATDPRSAAQRAEAKRLSDAERKASEQAERERKAADKTTEKAADKAAAAPGNLSPAAAAPAASKPASARNAAHDKPASKDFVATVPKPAPAPNAK